MLAGGYRRHTIVGVVLEWLCVCLCAFIFSLHVCAGGRGRGVLCVKPRPIKSSCPFSPSISSHVQVNNTAKAVGQLLTKLALAATKAVDVVICRDEPFDARRSGGDSSRAFRYRQSLKILGCDNIGFMKRGRDVGYVQFVRSRDHSLMTDAKQHDIRIPQPPSPTLTSTTTPVPT